MRFGFLFIGILLMAGASAGLFSEDTYQDAVEWNKELSYDPIENKIDVLRDSFFFSTDIASYWLLENNCSENLINCWAIGEAEFSIDGTLFDDMEFWKKVNESLVGGHIRSHRIWIWTKGLIKNESVEICSFNNETNMTECIDGIAEMPMPDWSLYSGEMFEAGQKVKWKMTAQKSPHHYLDWIGVVFNNSKLTPWALWQGSGGQAYQNVTLNNPTDDEIDLDGEVGFSCTASNNETSIENISVMFWQNESWNTTYSETFEQGAYYLDIYADSINEAGLEINGVVVTQLETGVWRLNTSDSNLDLARGKIMKTLFYGTDGTNPRVLSSITNLVSIKSPSIKDDDKRVYYIVKAETYLQGVNGAGGTKYFEANFTDTTNNFDVSSWTYLHSRKAIDSAVCYSRYELPTETNLHQVTASTNNNLIVSDYTGTDLSSWELDNPSNFKLINANDKFGNLYDSNEARLILLTSSPIEYYFSHMSDIDGVTDFYINYSIPKIEYVKPGSIDVLLNITEETFWTCQACDIDGDCSVLNATENRTVTLDFPQINLTAVNKDAGSKELEIVTNISAVGNLSYCYLNIYQGASLEVADTEIVNCSEAVNVNVSAYADYLINIYANTTTGIENVESFWIEVNAAPVEQIIQVSGGGGMRVIVEESKPIVYESVCEDFHRKFLNEIENAKEIGWAEGLVKLIRTYWDWAVCESASSIVGI